MENTFAKEKNYVRLTPRDLELFHLIESQGAKTSGELSQQFWNEKSRKAHAGFQRIRKLIESGFLIRGNPKLLYLSTSAKALILKERSASGVEGVVKHE